MREIDEWLGKWEPNFAGKHEHIELVPAVNARGYKWHPGSVPLPREKADFSQAPQLDWWLDDKRKSRKRRAGAHGIKEVLRSINNWILS